MTVISRELRKRFVIRIMGNVFVVKVLVVPVVTNVCLDITIIPIVSLAIVRSLAVLPPLVITQENVIVSLILPANSVLCAVLVTTTILIAYVSLLRLKISSLE